MSSIDAIPFLIFVLLLVLCVLLYYFDQKKFKQQVEDEMQEWFETEYKRNIKPLDRRGARRGGRRSYDK
jgi:hypothetical protein|tara:strand:+ start:395 stop:601 length:207 start_codon:yes stop_codon:yes gene_type:complete